MCFEVGNLSTRCRRHFQLTFPILINHYLERNCHPMQTWQLSNNHGLIPFFLKMDLAQRKWFWHWCQAAIHHDWESLIIEVSEWIQLLWYAKWIFSPTTFVSSLQMRSRKVWAWKGIDCYYNSNTSTMY